MGSFRVLFSHGCMPSLSFKRRSPVDCLNGYGFVYWVTFKTAGALGESSHLGAKMIYLHQDNEDAETGLTPLSRQADRLKSIRTSGIRRFSALGCETPDTINLTVGEPDFCPPLHALEAYCHAVNQGGAHYAPTNGTVELREALARKAHDDYGLSYSPDEEILVSAGGTEAVFLALMGLLNPKDEVLITDPGFVLYEPATYLSKGVPCRIPLLEENQFKPSLKDVTSLITNRSRVIILNYPSNPTGAVLSHDEIAALTKIAVERDLIVISDEAY